MWRMSETKRGTCASSRGKSSKSKRGITQANRQGGKHYGGAAVETGRSTLNQAPRELRITINIPTPSPNQWVRAHWSTYAKIKKAWMSHIHSASIRHCGTGLFGKPIGNASLTIERRGIRELDRDNLIGGMKPVIDCLIALGFLENDTPAVIQVMDVFQTRVGTKAEQQTRITIIDREL